MDWNVLYSKEKSPSLEQVTEYINNSLWADFNNRIQSTYRTRPCMEHSRCSMQAGWNIKYKKGGKSLCTLYLMPSIGKSKSYTFLEDVYKQKPVITNMRRNSRRLPEPIRCRQSQTRMWIISTAP